MVEKGVSWCAEAFLAIFWKASTLLVVQFFKERNFLFSLWISWASDIRFVGTTAPCQERYRKRYAGGELSVEK